MAVRWPLLPTGVKNARDGFDGQFPNTNRGGWKDARLPVTIKR